ncbi:MAG: iron-containing alcohol dehydrogenase [Syntrophaceae bacterium]|nr:iron-containing alcohol dehydrogenase [Syntrophaceae bacterium]
MFQTIPFNTPDILFGMDVVSKVGDYAKKLGAGRILLITGPHVSKAGIAEKVISSLKAKSLEFEIYDRMEQEPYTTVVERAAEVAREGKFLVFIGLGGGSVMDVAKMASALTTNPGVTKDYFGVEKVARRGKPTIMIPTTAGTGAEITKHAIFVDVEDHVKKAVASQALQPNVALIDPMLTITSPPQVTAAAGIDAFIHAAEPFVSQGANPLTDAIAINAMSMITRWVGPAYADGRDLEARYYVAMGSMMSSFVLQNSGTSLIHAIAYPIGGEYHTSHGTTLSALMPSCFEYIKVAKTPKFAEMAEAMGENIYGLSEREAADKAIEAIRALLKNLDLPGSLKDLGAVQEESRVKRWAIDAHKEQRLLSRCARQLTVEDIIKIINNAF